MRARLLSLLLGSLAIACGSDAASVLPAAGGSAGAASGHAGAGGAGAANGGAAAGGFAGGAGPGGSAGGNAAGNSAGGLPNGSAGMGGVQLPLFPPLIAGCDIPTAHARADSALASALVNFWSGADQYLRALSPSDGKLTGYWTYAQVFDALLDGVERTRGQHYQGLIRAFYEGRAARGWIVGYYDDEAWMTLALMRAFDLTGDARYLDTAEMIYADIMAAWDTTCCGSHLGGIWWDKKKTQKATASNAGPALAGVRLAAHTGKSAYLDFAKKTYAFWMSDMVDAATFAIYDHLSPNGQRGPGALTYNHGLMIAAALELSTATGEAHYLTEAHGFGQYLITHTTKPTSSGPVLSDGTNCNGDCAAWKGIGYRYLAELYRHDPTHDEYRTVLTGGAKALWDLAHDPTNDFFSSNWAGPAPTNGGVEAQGSAAMALNLYAMLCGSDLNAAPPPAGVYQAEEGWLDHVDAEATKGRGFIGFGYVSAFTQDKQGFTLDVTVPQAGTYDVAWRYTAGEGTCVRSVIVNGQAQAAALTFPATPSWTAWMTARSSATLPAGRSTIALRYDAAKGSKTSLDIDQLTLSAL